MTILEASLPQSTYDLGMTSGRAEYRKVFEQLLDAGATAYKWPRQQVPRRPPLVNMLLEIDASDELILRVADAGAPLNARGHMSEHYPPDFLTPLQAVVLHSRERLARELISRGADVYAPVTAPGGFIALQIACARNLSFRFLEYLVVVQGVDVNERPAPNGTTSLAAAVKKCSLNTVEFLLDHGADINATMESRDHYEHIKTQVYRSLDIAVIFGYLDKVEFLLKAGGRSGQAGLGFAIEIAAKKRTLCYTFSSTAMECETWSSYS